MVVPVVGVVVVVSIGMGVVGIVGTMKKLKIVCYCVYMKSVDWFFENLMDYSGYT